MLLAGLTFFEGRKSLLEERGLQICMLDIRIINLPLHHMGFVNFR